MNSRIKYVKKAIDNSGKPLSDVAKQLFPKHMHPVAALRRVLRGEASLNTDQIIKLAAVLSTTAAELIESDWKATPLDKRITFTKGDITVTVRNRTDARGGVLIGSVYRDGSLSVDELLFGSNIPLSDFLDAIDRVVEASEQ